jgi:hypothetical protein
MNTCKKKADASACLALIEHMTRRTGVHRARLENRLTIIGATVNIGVFLREKRLSAIYKHTKCIVRRLICGPCAAANGPSTCFQLAIGKNLPLFFKNGSSSGQRDRIMVTTPPFWSTVTGGEPIVSFVSGGLDQRTKP